MFEIRNYIIINSEELIKVDFTQVLQTDIDSVRRSVDGSKAILSWENFEPSFLSELTTIEGPYDWKTMKEIVWTDVWHKEPQL